MAKGEGRGAVRASIAAVWRCVPGLRPSPLALSLLWITTPLGAQDRAWWDTLPAAPPVATSWTYASQYVPMRDGVRLAVDTYLPDGVARPLATIVEQTRYRRQLQFRDPARNARPAPPSGLAAFLRAGYAVVVVDVRGTGASFGSRTTEFSPAEVRDGWDVLNWIVAQPWSNGVVGATGVSYPGTTAELMGTLGHPALKAVAPRFSIYDLYADVVFPGGIFLEPFMRAWGSMVARMDANQFDAPGGPVIGARPVDGPAGDSLLALAIAEHGANANIFAQVQDLEARDDTAADGFTFDDISPHARYDTLSRRIPIYSWGGWADGFSNASITRYLDQPSPGSRLIMGPWNHGGAWSYYPGSRPVRSQFNHLGELLRFFDHHLRGMDTGIDDEPPIHYFTTGSNEWKATERWPVGEAKNVHFTTWFWGTGPFELPDSGLALYEVPNDPGLGTGDRSRWNTILGGGAVYYPPRGHSSAPRRWLAFQQDPPLAKALTVTGHPVVRVRAIGVHDPTQLFVYLEEVDSTGLGHLVTEGQLSLAHRSEEPPDEGFPHPGTYHSFARSDLLPPLNGIAEFTIQLLPISHRFAAGTSIRLVLTRADRDHFAVPNDSTARLAIIEARLSLPLEP